MRRRAFITLLGGAAAGPSVCWPLAARAQQGERVRRIAVLMSLAETDSDGRARFTAFQQGLQKLGWQENRNLRFETRWVAGDLNRYPSHAAELVASAPDVILAGSGPSGLRAVQKETRTIPIVSVGVSDPASLGFVDSMARPGGNVTGFALFEFSIVGKMLETLKQIAPSVERAALLSNPDNPSHIHYLRAFEDAAASLAVEPIAAGVHDASEIKHALERLSGKPPTGLIVPPDTLAQAHRELIIELAVRHRLAAIYTNRAFTVGGGLMSYGADIPDLYRRSASYVDRILRGEKPSVLPVQAPTKFDLVLNLKTAKALGLDVSPMLLARADEVIE
jgi:putative ABC transport system substrate-binding protein